MTFQQKNERVIFNLLIGLAFISEDRRVNIAVETLKLGHLDFKTVSSLF